MESVAAGVVTGIGEGESLYRQIVERANAGVWVADEGGVISFLNRQMANLLGYEIDEMVGRSIHDFTDDAGHDVLESAHGGAASRTVQVGFQRKDGEGLWALVSITPLHNNRGQFAGLLGTITDVTDYHRAEQALEQRETWLQMVVNSAPIVLWALDAEGIVTLSEGRGLANLGFEPGELVGRNVFDLYPDEEESNRSVRRALAGESFSDVVRNGDLWFETTYSALFDERGEPAGTIAVSQDITDRKRAEQRVEFLAYHDELTGLPNRSLFQDHLSLAIARARRRQHAVALLYLDLDRFKLVNDSFGHARGDELLKRIATRLRRLVRAEDLVARHSGDEFLVLLADLPLRTDRRDGSGPVGAVRTAEVVAQKVHDALREPIRIAGQELTLDASIGISLYPRDASDSESLLQHADIAMYESKRLGRGGSEVFGRTSQDAAAQISVAGRLRGALDRDELVLHYQPIIELSTGRIRGVEALLRWYQPGGGMLQPDDFISVAEEIGMLTCIDDWVVSEASRQWKLWHDEGLDLQVSINLSSLQFRSPDLAERLIDRISAAGADPSGIVLEITESAVMADTEVTARILQKLRSSDLHAAIDDFGSGYSSLSRLADLPVNMLKMDGSFVRTIPQNQAASVMVAGIVQIARDMGVFSLAEGIEREAQRDFLAGCGCDLGQGFAFSEALEPDALGTLARAQR